jgi:dolichyl-phosphate-mannose--protein O-mannosyl transferase
MPDDGWRGWIVALIVTVLGGLVRFWNLGYASDYGSPIFDEKHYVPQAWQMLRNGGYEDNPGYELVVHPPLAKDFIAVGEWLFGYDPTGWRVASALVGTLMILMIVRIGRRLTRSTFLGALAGILLICDGVTHVMSRVGLLDIFVTFFVVMAFGALLVDRDQARERMAVVVAEGRVLDSVWGPRLGFRWWRFAAALSLGMCCGTKWNGIYYVVFFTALSVVWDALARRTAGVRRPWLGTLVRDAFPAFWSLFVIAIVVYLGTWWAWFASETATDRHAILLHSGIGFRFLPPAVRSWIYYQANVLNFHIHLVTGNHPHPWESKPWSWPMGTRPMLFYYESQPGCGPQGCVSAIMLIGTPAMWWISLPVATWGLWRAFSRMDWRYMAVIVGYCAGFLPWFSDLARQMFFYYAVPLAPFLVLGIVLVLGDVLGPANADYERRKTGLLVVALYVGIVVANFVWLWPILNGYPISPAHWQAELWWPSWR